MSEKKVEIRGSDGRLIKRYYETREDVNYSAVPSQTDAPEMIILGCILIVLGIPALFIVFVIGGVMLYGNNPNGRRQPVNTNRTFSN